MKIKSNGPAPGFGKPWKAVESAAHAHVNLIEQPGAAQIGARNLGMARLKLQRDDAAALGQRASHPDGGVAAESADLKHALRLRDPDQHMEKLALQR